MTMVELRQELSAARSDHQSYEEIAEVIRLSGNDHFKEKSDRLAKQESLNREHITALLDDYQFTPRQYSILYLHYLNYRSWTQIAEILHIERRYALQIHKLALERLLEQINGQHSNDTRSA